MTMAVQGMACLGSFGTGLAALVRREPLAFVHEDGRAATADVSGLKDRLPARALRQMDHFSRMALLCLLQMLEDAGIPVDGGFPDAGIILTTGYGPASPTFAFLDSILSHGEMLASPLSFSHSVHNIPAASLAMTLGLTGSCATFCQLDNPVVSGLLAARTWLEEGRVSRVFFGAVDEHTPLLARTSRRIAAQRKTPRGVRAALPPSEGAAFFCLASPEANPRHGWIETIDTLRAAPDGIAAAFTSEPAEPLLLSGAVPRELASRSGACHAGTVYGNIPVAQAFDLALALACPEMAPAGRASCCGFDRHGEVAAVRIRRTNHRSAAR